MKYFFQLLLFLLIPLSLLGQNTTVTGTVTDPDGFLWVGGTVQFTLYNNAGGTVTQNGVPLTAAQMNKTVSINSSGAFSMSLASNNTLSPVGTEWTLLICPAASAPCQTFPMFTATGATLSLTTAITSQIQALRFPASYTARAYGDVEISPLPPPGGTYFNLQSANPRYWNGIAWTNYGTGGGGGTPSAPVGSIQVANPALSGFDSDSNFLINKTTHTRTSSANDIVNAVTNLPRRIIDPMDTQFNGGLAAAIAGTSGFTPAQVINAAADYGECIGLMTTPHTLGSRIALPSGVTLFTSQVLLWPDQELSGESVVNHPILQHSDGSVIMVDTHAQTDTLTCSNSITYTPGGATGILVRNVAISGIGSTVNDIGIHMHCQGCLVENITGTGNGFGGPAVWMDGTSVFGKDLGYEGGQLKGCQTYITGAQPITAFSAGHCGTVQMDVLDGELDNTYDTDGGAFLSGHGPSPCYPWCAANWIGAQNGHANKLFGQVSDIDIIVSGTNARLNDLRADFTSMEALRVISNANIIEGLTVISACTSTNLQANYNAGIATGCYAVNETNTGGFNGGNFFSNINVGAAPGIFAPSYVQANFGSNSTGSILGTGVGIGGNANNMLPNAWSFFYNGTGNEVKYFAENVPGQLNSGGIANINGLSILDINTSTPLSGVIGATNGQLITMYAAFSQGIATINNNFNGNGASPYGIITCSGLPITVTVTQGALFQYTINNISELGCDTQLSHLHINWGGNPVPTNPSIADIYGNMQMRQIPTFPIDVLQIHGPTVGGSACFIQTADFTDGSQVASLPACTNVDLANQTPGAVFVAPTPPQATMNLWLISNTQGNGVSLGKYPPHVVIGAPSWNNVTIAAGGDGSTPPASSTNTTGLYLAPWGVVINTYNNIQPTCDAYTRGKIWLNSGGGTGPDNYQGCIQTTGGAYVWANLGSGGVTGVSSIDGLTGAFTFGGPGVSHSGNSYTFSGGGSSIAKIEITVGVTPVPANSCLSPQTVTMTGVSGTTPHSTFQFTGIADYSTVVGWGANSPGLYFWPWATANTLNYRECNGTGLSITPGSSTTWSVSTQ